MTRSLSQPNQQTIPGLPPDLAFGQFEDDCAEAGIQSRHALRFTLVGGYGCRARLRRPGMTGLASLTFACSPRVPDASTRVQCPAGGAVPVSTIHKILRHRLYTGEFDWKEQLCKGRHRPLVTHTLWERVRGVLDSRKTRKRARYTSYHGTGDKGNPLAPSRRPMRPDRRHQATGTGPRREADVCPAAAERKAQAAESRTIELPMTEWAAHADVPLTA